MPNSNAQICCAQCGRDVPSGTSVIGWLSAGAFGFFCGDCIARYPSTEAAFAGLKQLLVGVRCGGAANTAAPGPTVSRAG